LLLVLTPLCANAQMSPSPTAPSPTATPYFNRTPVPGVSASPSPSSMASASPLTSPGNWDPFADMQRMQTEMNQFFSRAMSEFGMNQNFLSMRNEPGFSSSIDVRDKGDHYEVHAFLPGSEINNVKVTAESNNRLRVAASESKQQKKETKGSEMLTSEFGDYEQVVTLPGPARTKDMKVERKEREVVVRIPKK
jgi:HSP20 family molecular chaperone IbpA